MPSSQPILMDIGKGVSIMIGLPTIASWDTLNRPKKTKAGTIGFNVQTSKLEYWNGSYWFEALMDKT